MVEHAGLKASVRECLSTSENNKNKFIVLLTLFHRYRKHWGKCKIKHKLNITSVKIQELCDVVKAQKSIRSR